MGPVEQHVYEDPVGKRATERVDPARVITVGWKPASDSAVMETMPGNEQLQFYQIQCTDYRGYCNAG